MSLSSGYKKYMKSEKWFAYRERRLAQADYECEICSNYGCTLQVHHLTYKNFMNERDEDTLVVCKPCHKYVDRIRKIMKKFRDERSEKYVQAKELLKWRGYPWGIKSQSRKPIKDLWKQLKKIDEGTYKTPREILNNLSEDELEALKEML